MFHNNFGAARLPNPRNPRKTEMTFRPLRCRKAPKALSDPAELENILTASAKFRKPHNSFCEAPKTLIQLLPSSEIALAARVQLCTGSYSFCKSLKSPYSSHWAVRRKL